jgi:hypothetical protein
LYYRPNTDHNNISGQAQVGNIQFPQYPNWSPPYVSPSTTIFVGSRKVKSIEYYPNGTVKRVEYEA